MSRVGNRVLTIPKGVSVEIKNSIVAIKGKLGQLSREFSPLIAITQKDEQISTIRANEEKQTKQFHGTTNSLIEAMLIGVSQGFKKELAINGVGYRATLKGKNLEVAAGYSYPHLIAIPEDIEIETPKPTIVIVTGIDKQKVGHMAAIIRAIRKPNPYSGKGIMYKDEHIKRKEGKAASK